jgi:hypothetical protein
MVCLTVKGHGDWCVRTVEQELMTAIFLPTASWIRAVYHVTYECHLYSIVMRQDWWGSEKDCALKKCSARSAWKIKNLHDGTEKVDEKSIKSISFWYRQREKNKPTFLSDKLNICRILSNLDLARSNPHVNVNELLLKVWSHLIKDGLDRHVRLLNFIYMLTISHEGQRRKRVGGKLWFTQCAEWIDLSHFWTTCSGGCAWCRKGTVCHIWSWFELGSYRYRVHIN